MRFDLEVVVRRGSVVESRHRLQCAAVDVHGTPVAGTPHADLVTMFRSAAKPFQLLPLVERGHAERFGFSDEQLAVMASSHAGARYHVELVTGILARLGLGPAHLACGYHDPDDPVSRDDLARGGLPRTALYNNCSGKHAGQLALALAEGWPLEGYHLPGHPAQQLVRRTIAEVCGVAPGSFVAGVDGCSLPVFAMPLGAMARGYAALGAAKADGDARTRALARIARAMTSYPVAIEGAGRPCTRLMEVTRGRLVAKHGAEGLMLLAARDRGLGIALKCEDGAMRAVAPAAVSVLEWLGLLAPAEAAELAALRRPPLTNVAGLEVGALEAALKEVALA
jgi:L-asparaginase II